MRFTHIDVNFNVTHEGHQNWSKYFLLTDFLRVLITIICDTKIDLIVYETHCVKIFFMNLHSPAVCLFDIVITSDHVCGF